MTCLSAPASPSDDAASERWFPVPLNVIHCLFGSVSHPMQLHTCTQEDMLDTTREAFRWEGKVPRLQMAPGQRIHIGEDLFLWYECWQGQSNGKCPCQFVTGRPQSKHQAFRAWILETRLQPQPEPKRATYLQSIIEVVLDFILAVLLTLNCLRCSGTISV